MLKTKDSFIPKNPGVLVPKMKVLNLVRQIFRVGFPIHKPYIKLSLCRWVMVGTSILGT